MRTRQPSQEFVGTSFHDFDTYMYAKIKTIGYKRFGYQNSSFILNI